MSETRTHRRHWFQYSLRSLLLLTLLPRLGMSWIAVKMQTARRQKEAVEAIRKLGGRVEYDYEVDQSGNPISYASPPEPVWLRNMLGEDFFATVVDVSLDNSSVTDAALEHLKGLTQLQWLALDGTPVTDAGLKHLKNLTRLQWLGLDATQVTDAGLEHLKRLSRLQSLGLGNTEVTDAGLEHLKGLT